jgi:antitoxin HicB
MKYHFKVHKEGKSYWAECLELKGCMTQGYSLAELGMNMREALDLYLSEPEDSKSVFPEPNKKFAKKADVVAVPVSPNVAAAVRIRMMRLAHHWTQSEVKDKMGMKGLYSYQRLESPEDANPTLETLARIKKIFPEFSVDELLEVEETD